MKPIKRDLTQEQLKDRLNYDPETGVFIWSESVLNSGFSGKVAGHVNMGYIAIEFAGISYMAHRMAWLYVTGSWPKDQIDHISQCRSDNRFMNLREVNNSENQKNVALRKSNKSGIMGVHVRSDNGKWSVRISDNGNRYTLGSFDDFFEACCVRKSAEIRYGFHANHGRSNNG